LRGRLVGKSLNKVVFDMIWFNIYLKQNLINRFNLLIINDYGIKKQEAYLKYY
jgi:hypothetical protein